MPQTTASAPAPRRASDIGAIGDASGREHRIVSADRGTDPSKQLHRRHRPANVAPGLDPLGDHRVGSGIARRQCLLDRAALVDPGLGRPAPRGAPEGDHHVGLGSRLEVAPASERQQEVDRQRPVAQPAGRGNLPPQIGREPGCRSSRDRRPRRRPRRAGVPPDRRPCRPEPPAPRPRAAAGGRPSAQRRSR